MSRKPLLIIFITVFVDLLGFAIVLPLLPRYAQHFLPSAVVRDAASTGQTTQEMPAVINESFGSEAAPIPRLKGKAGLILGCLMASFSLMQFLFAPLWGILSDRIGRRPVLLIGLAGSTIFYFLFAVVTHLGNSGPILGFSPLALLFVTRIGAGISGATIPTAQAYIADCTDEKSRGKGMALIGAAFGIGFTFGPILGSFFVPGSRDALPSPAPGYVASVLSGFAFLFGLMSLPESLKPDAARRSSAQGWFRMGAMPRVIFHKVLGPIVLAIFMTTFAFGQFETTLTMLTERMGVSARVNFYIFAYIGLTLTLAQGVLVRRLIPRIGESRMAMIGVALMTVGLFLVGQTALAKSFWLLVAVLPIVVVGFSSTTPSLNSMLSLNSGDDEQGEVLGVGQSLSSLARIVAPVVGFWLQDRGLAFPYWSASALMAFGILIVARLKSGHREPQSQRAEPIPGH